MDRVAALAIAFVAFLLLLAAVFLAAGWDLTRQPGESFLQWAHTR